MSSAISTDQQAIILNSVAQVNSDVELPCDDSMEMQFYFSIDDSTHTLHQASWFVLILPLKDDLFQRCPRLHGKGRLVNDLIAGIEFRDDEVAGRSEGEHTHLHRVMIRANSGKAGKEAVVKIDDPPPSEFPACIRR